MGDLVAGLSVLALLLLAAYLTLAEAAIARTTKVKAHHLVDQKKRGAERLLDIVQDPAPFMNVLLLLSLLARVGGVVIATAWAIDSFGGACRGGRSGDDDGVALRDRRGRP